jgi:oxygen-dependent protoporphyrinogen oxidase
VTDPIVVVGGGIAGLAAAHRVTELAAARPGALPVVLLEAGTRVGGSIASERAGGFLIERGADSMLTEKPWGMALCRRLGLEDRMIRTNEGERRTYVVHDGRLHPLPEGFLLLAPTAFWPLLGSPLFSWRGKLRMAADLVLPRAGAREDESLASFVTRRLGREALERVAQPLVGGIYTADPERLSLAATMPRFLEMERRERSVILAMWRQARAAARAGAAAGSGARWTLFASFVDGMQTLTDALAERLPEGAVRLGTRVVGLAPKERAGWLVTLADGAVVHAAGVVLAAPAYVTAKLLEPLDPALASQLETIGYASSATVTMAFARGDVPHPLDAFGFVVPAVERRTAIACSFPSTKYAGRAPAGAVLLRVFFGGMLAEAILARSDDELVQAARAELGALLGVHAAPSLVRLHRHPRAMPQYDVGHLARVRAIEASVRRHPGLALAGGAYRGVGIPDCVRGGEEAAERLLGAKPPE